MVDNTVVVFPSDPKKPAEKHTRANARDLVNGAGYTWQRNVPTTPAAIPPFATAIPPEGPHPSQRALDSAGGSNQTLAPQAPAAFAPTFVAAIEEEGVLDFSEAPAPVAEDAAIEEAEEAEEAVEAVPEPVLPPTRGRGRPRS